jgi:Xaa-Pro aminopeptidase
MTAENLPLLMFGETLHHPSMLWRTGFLVPEASIYLEAAGKATLVVPPIELGRAQREFKRGEARSFDDYGLATIQPTAASADEVYAAMTAALLAEHGVRRARVESQFPLGLARALEAQGIELINGGALFAAEMRQKTPEQLAGIAAAQAAAARAVDTARGILAQREVREGRLYHEGQPLTSTYLGSKMEAQLMREGFSVEAVIVAGGAGAADAHVFDTGHLAADEPVVFDVFPQGKASRYRGDLSRTVVPGEPTPTWRRMYDATLAAHQAALATIGPGVEARAVHAAVVGALRDGGFDYRREVIREGAAPVMNHATGHGIGLQVHEAPLLGDAPGTLEVGDVLAFEPGLYSIADGCVRLEDIVEVTADGCRLVAEAPLGWEV